MSGGFDLAIVSTGAVSPVGLAAPATCAALDAGIARLGPVELPEGSVTGARVPTEWLRDPFRPGAAASERLPDPVSGGAERLAQIAVPAAREAWTGAESPGKSPTFGLYLALSEEDSAEAVAPVVIQDLGRRPTAVESFRLGRAALFPALRKAAEDLREGRVQRALVGAVDSRIRPESVGAGTPGEAAAFVVLERDPSAAMATDRVSIGGIAVEEEPTAGTQEPNAAEGLTRALRATREAAPDLTAPPLFVSDLNGDRYRAMEWAMAFLRVFGDLHGESDVLHPADCCGDTGAASGGLSLVWAVSLLRSRRPAPSHALVWGASDGSNRGSALLTAANTETPGKGS